MIAPSLRIDDHTLSAEQLRAGDFDAPMSANTRAALDFCCAWLAGDQTFTLHTSGSTGIPKAIELGRAQMEASARATLEAVGITPGMGSLVCMPARYIAGRMMLVRGLVGGLQMQIVESAANPLLDGYVTHFDFTALVPMQMQAILAGSAEGIARLNQARAILIGGGPVSVALGEGIAALDAPVYHTYGMTETVSHVALRRMNGVDAEARFRPLAGVVLGVDERGCLNIRASMTNGELIQTNDVVTLDADGSFVWRGRLDNVINSGGVKVYVEDVEARIERVLADLDAARWVGTRYFLAPLADARLGESVALILEGAPLAADEEQALLATLRAALGPYETPRHIRYVRSFVQTPTGKVDRGATVQQMLASQ